MIKVDKINLIKLIAKLILFVDKVNKIGKVDKINSKIPWFFFKSTRTWAEHEEQEQRHL